MRSERDPDAIEFSSPDAAAYAERAETLSRAVALRPLERLSYGSDRGQQLEVYAPAHARDLPILVFFHGGAWINGHLGWVRFMAPCVTELGVIFVAGTYRLAPRCRWPAQHDDVRHALATVRREIHRFGGDPDCVAIGGHSAGGHLASLTAFQHGQAGVRACLPVSAPFDLQHGEVPLDSREGRVYRYLFSVRSQDREASPIEFVRPCATAFHIVWGENDLPHVARSSRAMVQALEEAGVPVTWSIVPGASHFHTHLGLADPENPWYARLRAVLQ